MAHDARFIYEIQFKTEADAEEAKGDIETYISLNHADKLQPGIPTNGICSRYQNILNITIDLMNQSDVIGFTDAFNFYVGLLNGMKANSSSGTYGDGVID